MKRDGWTTGVPLNTEFVAGCSHGTMPAHMCGPHRHTPETYTHTIVLTNGQCARRTQPLLHVTSRFNFAVLRRLTAAVMCPLHTHPACFENVQECMREDAGGEGEKKFVQLQEPERSQEQHPIPERFPWRQVWQRTMRVRESDEREGERERAGEE